MPHDLPAQLRALLFDADRQRADEQALTAHLGETLTAASSLLGVDGAGLMLFDEQDVLRVIGVSDHASAVLEYAQEQLETGPGIDCVHDGRTVAVDDLSEEDAYPTLWEFLIDGEVAPRGAPFHAVLSVPVVAGEIVAGTFNVMSTLPRRWTREQTEAVEAYAAVIAVLLTLGAAAQHRSAFRPGLREEDDDCA